MGKLVGQGAMQALCDNIKNNCDYLAVCTTSEPATFFHVFWPAMWVAETAYIVGDLVRPPDNNGFIYECITGGTTGTLEPVWGTVQDDEFNDGTATWRTHENYSLIFSAMVPEDFTSGAVAGAYRLTVGPKAPLTSHAAGTVGHIVLVNTTAQEILLVTTANTSVVENDDILAGRLTQTDAFYLDLEDAV